MLTTLTPVSTKKQQICNHQINRERVGTIKAQACTGSWQTPVTSESMTATTRESNTVATCSTSDLEIIFKHEYEAMQDQIQNRLWGDSTLITMNPQELGYWTALATAHKHCQVLMSLPSHQCNASGIWPLITNMLQKLLAHEAARHDRS